MFPLGEASEQPLSKSTAEFFSDTLVVPRVGYFYQDLILRAST